MTNLKLRITYLEDAGVARTLTMHWALGHGMSREQSARAAIVASELCTNMVKYAEGGELIAEFDHSSRSACIKARDGATGSPSLPGSIPVYEQPTEPEDVPRPTSGLSFSRGATSENTPHREGTLHRFCDEVTSTPLPDGGMEVVCRLLANGEGEEPADPAAS